MWLDEADLKPGRDWEMAAEEGISASDVVLALLTPHAVRRPDGVCLDELSYARAQGKQIVPLMVERCLPPLSISRVQWLDMEAWSRSRERYEQKLDQIRDVIEGRHLCFEGSQTALLDRLRPIDFGAEIDDHVRGFYGRRWVFDRIDAWLEDAAAPKTFLLTGDPGVGKSAIAARLCQRHERVVAWHFCAHGDTSKTDALQCVRSLAYQMSSQLPDYRQGLLGVRLDERANALTAFDQLIVQPLRGVGDVEFPFLIVVDGLDEATRDGENEMAAFLARAFRFTPPWLRLLTTSRPEKLILSKNFGRLRPWVLDRTDPENLEDLHRFLVRELSRISETPVSERQIQAILDRSEGVFLYVVLVIEEIHEGRLSFDRLDDFPHGLHAVYGRFFDRYFSAEDPERRAYKEAAYDKYQRPLLELVAAAQEPLPSRLIAELLGWDSYGRKRALDPLGLVLKTLGERIGPSHLSIVDWLTHEDTELRYFIDAAKGHARIADLGWARFNSDPATMNTYLGSYLPSHLLATRERARLLAFLSDIQVFVSFFRHDVYRYIGYWNGMSRLDESGRQAFGDSAKHLIEQLASWEDSTDRAKRDWETYWSLGRLFFELQHEHSIEVFKKALSYLPSDLEDGATRALLCNEIGEAIARFGQAADAEPYYRKALSIRQESPENKADLAESTNNYGHVFFYQGSFNRALEQYKLALEVWETVPQGPHYGVADSLHNIAATLKRLGRTDEARTAYERCAAILDRLDYFNWGVPVCRRNCGDFLAEIGELDEAERQYRLALTACKQTYGEDHVSTIECAKKIAMLNFRRGEPEKAIADVRVAATACEQWYGRFHPKTIHTYNQFGEWLMAEGRLSEAHELLTDMVVRLGKSETRDPEIDAQALHDMGACCFYLKEYEEALEYLLRAYSMREELYSPGHEYIVRTFRFILQACLDDRRLEEAARLALEHHSVHVTAMQRTESLYFETQAMLARALRICGEWDSAQGIYEEIIRYGENLKRALETEGISKDGRICSLAVAYNEVAFHGFVPQRKWPNAEEFYRRAIHLMSAQEIELETANMRLNLFTVLRKSGAVVDTKAVERETQMLEAAEDPRAEKGRAILEDGAG